MSAEVETMFSANRVVPWHGLGVVLDSPPTAEDAIVAAGLDWTVSPEPLYVSVGDDTKKVKGYFANVRSSDHKVLGVVSSKYSIVQNHEAFQFVNSLIDSGDLTFETAGALCGGKVVWLLGNMPKTYILDDEYIPYVCFTNSFNGQGSIRCSCVTTRVVCMNTLNLALSTAKRSWSAVHRGNMESKLVEAKHTLGLITDYTEALKVEAERLAAIRISDDAVEAMLDNIYAPTENDSDIRKRRIEMLKQNVFNCMQAEDIKQYRGSAYGVMMAVTDFADHSIPLRMTSNYRENRWGQIINGHPFVDKMYKMVVAA